MISKLEQVLSAIARCSHVQLQRLGFVVSVHPDENTNLHLLQSYYCIHKDLGVHPFLDGLELLLFCGMYLDPTTGRTRGDAEFCVVCQEPSGKRLFATKPLTPLDFEVQAISEVKNLLPVLDKRGRESLAALSGSALQNSINHLHKKLEGEGMILRPSPLVIADDVLSQSLGSSW